MTAIKQQWRNGGQKLASALKREQTKKLASCFGKAIGKKEYVVITIVNRRKV